MAKDQEVPATVATAAAQGGPTVLRVLAGGKHTGGACAIFESTVPPNEGMPTHVHRREDEHLYVASGTFVVRVGDRTTMLGPGGCARMPRNVPHGFRNVGEGVGRVVVTSFPAGVEVMYADLDELAARIAPSTPRTAEIAAVSLRYGVDFLSGPPRCAPDTLDTFDPAGAAE